MEKNMAIGKVVNRVYIKKQENNFAYWQSQPYEPRLAALEEIRQEYNRWKYGAEQRF